MSAGKFSRALYTTDDGVKIPIRVQPETLEATFGGAINSSPTGAATSGYPSAVVSKSKRSIGIHPRTVTIEFTGAAPTGYKAGQTYTIPCLTELVFDSATKGAAANYLGQAAEVVTKSKEVIV